ncbi:DinB family protein [Pseudoxanthomonas helianthi]|uniref:DinB family protein n=1 Tax=Pseudoxanthomonas helianthi TaxID=1453541 RepID=A0A940X2X3_9GAMM|nr:DinB family protein [Pseudoxanthomonas helianthi]MBP3983635.1 DinB family protein [Pseudoxanthomonas helianthi]
MKHQFRYKTWANTQILDALAQVDSSRYPSEWNQAIRLVNHTYVVDRIFAAHLSGAARPFDATNTPETPTLDGLRESIAKSDAWFQEYVERIGGDALDETIAFTFTDGQRGSMTRAEMLFHVLAHGTYHRGNVGMVLVACGVDRPSDTFTRFLHLAEPERRERA